ncbi:MAG: reverse transcriptase/maturase family protein [Candidatus Paceibacterota bacterium]
MKTYNNIFHTIASIPALYAAWERARRGKRYRMQVLHFGYNLEDNLVDIRDELHDGTYTHGQYRTFIVRDSKKRLIKAACFRDRVVHNALYYALETIFEPMFIYDSYACREGKGTHVALDRAEHFMHKTEYVLTSDISKYFATINHEILLSLIKHKIRDRRVVDLCRIVIESSYDLTYGKGIPIGNLTSQLFANIYLNELDQFIKRELKAEYYIRYMDDIVIFSNDKKYLHECSTRMNEFLEEKLKLVMNPRKVAVFPHRTGLDFLGFRLFPHHRLLRRSTVQRFVRRTRAYRKMVAREAMTQDQFDRSIESWYQYARKGSSWGLRRDLERRLDIPFTY